MMFNPFGVKILVQPLFSGKLGTTEFTLVSFNPTLKKSEPPEMPAARFQ